MWAPYSHMCQAQAQFKLIGENIKNIPIVVKMKRNKLAGILHVPFNNNSIWQKMQNKCGKFLMLTTTRRLQLVWFNIIDAASMMNVFLAFFIKNMSR
jgi:hypothetical protein